MIFKAINPNTDEADLQDRAQAVQADDIYLGISDEPSPVADILW